MTFELTITEDITPDLVAMRSLLQNPARLHGAIATWAELLTKDYLRDIAPSRHAAAGRLGAKPTGVLEKAAESPEGAADATQATVTIRPGELFARVDKDVVILPRSGKFLTIPVAAEAYGRRAREFGDRLHYVEVGPRRQPVLAARAANGGLVVYYLLLKAVNQKQDRKLLPSDAAYEQVMTLALEELFEKTVPGLN